MAAPLLGIGYRDLIGDWIVAHLDRFDVLEFTVDHFFYGGEPTRAALERLSRQVPLVAHGVGLSLGTDAPLDEPYLREVADVVDRLGALGYSEHLAFTKVPDLDLGNLLPLPRTPETAEWMAERVRRVRELLPVPFDLENIAYLFAWPDDSMSDGAFLRDICERSGAGVMLDVENLFVNAANHGLDPTATLAEIPPPLVRGMHMAGGGHWGDVLLDGHDHSVPDGAIELLGAALCRFRPETLILERDDRIEETEEILADLARLRACLAIERTAVAPSEPPPAVSATRSTANAPLRRRQRELIAFLTDPSARPDDPVLSGLDPARLEIERELSVGKRMAKVRSAFPATLAHLDEPAETLFRDFATAFPPYDIGRAENAVQFAAFLRRRWRTAPPARAYVPDLMRIELAFAIARRRPGDGGDRPRPELCPAIRCAVGAQFLRCRHDVSGILGATGADAPAPIERDLRLIVLPPRAADGNDANPRIVEVSALLQDAIEALDDWRPLEETDPLGIGAPPAVVRDLVASGLLELFE